MSLTPPATTGEALDRLTCAWRRFGKLMLYTVTREIRQAGGVSLWLPRFFVWTYVAGFAWSCAFHYAGLLP